MNKSNLPFTKKYSGELIMLLVTLLWGATFAIIKEALNDISTMLFISIRFSIVGVLLLPILFIKKVDFNKSVIYSGCLLGFILFMGFATQTVGLKYTTATKSGFLTGTAVVIIPILQTIIEKKKPSKGSILGTVIVIIGILFMSSGGESIISFVSGLGSHFNFGDLLTLICAFFFALYVVYLDVVSKKYGFLQLLFLQILVIAFLGFLSSQFFSYTAFEYPRINFTPQLIFALFYTSIFATLITTALQTKYQKLISPTKAGIIFSFEPIFAATIAFFLLSEKITNFGLIGASLIFIGLIVSEVYDNIIKNGKQAG